MHLHQDLDLLPVTYLVLGPCPCVHTTPTLLCTPYPFQMSPFGIFKSYFGKSTNFSNR